MKLISLLCMCIGFDYKLFPQLMNYYVEFWKSFYKNSDVFGVNTPPTVSYNVATDFLKRMGSGPFILPEEILEVCLQKE